MVSQRQSASSTQQYPVGDSKYPARLSRGVELPQLKPLKGQIGPYELVAELGSGGMGTVYVARRTYEVGVTRTLALKTLRQDLSSHAELVEMFLDQARITARISHPYVCSVMDIGTHRGVPYVTMDYLVGEPLSRLGPLMADDHSEVTLAILVRVVANLCEGLHAAHELRDERGEVMRVVHRDISPDNLFVLYDGSVRVTDFGIALTAAQQKDGKSSALAGQSGYMAPEQLRGMAVDRRADLWSIGVVLWELLAGKRLFRAGSDDVAATVAVLEGTIPPPSRFHSEVPKGLDAVVMRALERDRDKRYPTARAMAIDLEQVLARCFEPVSAGQVSAWLDEQFPNCHEFRRTIVARAMERRDGVEKFEFEPPLGISTSTRPPANAPASSLTLERGLDSLAPLDESQTPSITEDLRLALGPALKFPEPPRAPTASLESIPSPRRRLAQGLILVGALGMVGLVALTARKPAEVAARSPAQRPASAAPVAQLVEAPVVAQPPPTEPPSLGPTLALQAPPALATAKRHPIVEGDKAKLGEVYVFASSGSYEVILRERVIKAPALLKLPIGTNTIGVRKQGERIVRQVKVSPQPGRPTMVRIDL
jgi:eukaryotic-like serine/threonine-protein kinase